MIHQPPRPSALLEAMEAAVDLASLVGTYHAALCAQGFEEPFALALAGALQQAVMESATSCPG